MTDPLTTSSAWLKPFEVYAEKHKVYQVFLETFREIIVNKPRDPLVYIRDEIQRIAQTVKVLRAFVIGDPVAAEEIGGAIASKTGAIYLSIHDISTGGLKRHDWEKGSSDEKRADDEFFEKLQNRIGMEDCANNGFVIGGFPRTKLEALYTQQLGIIPRLVVALLPAHPGGNPVGQTNKLGRSTSVTKSVDGKSGRGMVGDIAEIYDTDVCQVLTYELWSTTPVSSVADDVLSVWSLKGPIIPTWYPKIAIIGPPSAGKSTLGTHLAARFQLHCIDWNQAVRGATNSNDEQVSHEAKLYIEQLQPLSKTVSFKILQSRLHGKECQRKGWILDGFPQNRAQAELLEEMSLTPNRIFLLSVPEAVCKGRIDNQRTNAYERRIPPELFANVCQSQDCAGCTTPGADPYAEDYVRQRFYEFTENLGKIIDHYSSDILEVDGSQPVGTVNDIVETFVLRPPV